MIRCAPRVRSRPPPSPRFPDTPLHPAAPTHRHQRRCQGDQASTAWTSPPALPPAPAGHGGQNPRPGHSRRPRLGRADPPTTRPRPPPPARGPARCHPWHQRPGRDRRRPGAWRPGRRRTRCGPPRWPGLRRRGERRGWARRLQHLGRAAAAHGRGGCAGRPGGGRGGARPVGRPARPRGRDDPDDVAGPVTTEAAFGTVVAPPTTTRPGTEAGRLRRVPQHHRRQRPDPGRGPGGLVRCRARARR